MAANFGCQSMGIKRYSALLKYNFNPIDQTPQDVMHVLLEGIARRICMKIFDAWFADKNRTSLSEINFRLSNFPYGYSHKKNRISPLSEFDLKKSNLIISASEMHTLLLLFPIIFYDIIDVDTDEYK